MKQYIKVLVYLLMSLQSGVTQSAGSALDRREESLLSNLRQSEKDGAHGAALHHQVATFYHAQGRWPLAERHYRRAVKLWTKGRNENGRILSIRNLAALYLDTGQPRKAEHLGLDRLATRLNPASVEFAGATGTIGAIHHAFRRYPEAEARYVESARAFEQVAPDTSESLQVLNNLALLFYQTGRTSEALEVYERALARAASAGLRAEQVSLLANLGALKFTFKEPEAALWLYQQAIDLAPTTLGPQHPAIVRFLENRSAILRELNRSEEAREMDARAVAIRAASVFTINTKRLADGASQHSGKN